MSSIRQLKNKLFSYEKFISLINKEPFDYTQWQSTLWSEQTIEHVSEKAMNDRTKDKG
ncbi:MAG: hypothetical protein Q8P34_14590 [Bacteroidota bacterium]|nr:hypothetical protein [Bacteroidota bacterium]